MAQTNTRILVAESSAFSPRAEALLRQIGDLVLADLDRPGLLIAVRDSDVLWTRLRHRIDAELMGCAPRLKTIVTATTGLNHIDLEETNCRGIRILSLRGETRFLKEVRAAAEHTVALILALLRHVPAAVAHVRNGGWNRDLFRGRELYENTAGLIGYGRVGQQVAHYLQALGMRVLVTDPTFRPGAVEPSVTSVPLRELLREADVVTLHVNYKEENRLFFGHELFSSMKLGAWFINTSRGELVDEAALLEALQCKHIAGAALDVLSDEHRITANSHPLIAYSRTFDNLIITPHIGGCTIESMEKTEAFLAQKLAALFLPQEHGGVGTSCP